MKQAIKTTKSFGELLDIKYGKVGSKRRDEFEKRAETFVVNEMMKETLLQSNNSIERLK